MKRLQLFYFLLWAVISPASAQSAFWEQAVGPYGGNVGIYTTNGNVVYAEYRSGAYFRSEDFGEHWNPLSLNPAVPGAYSEQRHFGRSGAFYSVALVQVNNNWIRQLYRSLDEGVTWELRKDDFNLQAVWETPSAALIGFDNNSNLYRSADGGLTWVYKGNFGVQFSIYSTSIQFGDNGKILLVGFQGPLVYSTNDGQSWQTGGDAGLITFSDICMLPSGLLFRVYDPPVLNDTILYRSDNWGLVWQAVNLDLPDAGTPQSFMELPGGRILLSTDRQILYSDDNGITWELLPTGPERAYSFRSTAPLSNGHLLGSAKGALFRSVDNGASWAFSAYNMKFAETTQLALLTDSLQLAVTQTGLWRTLDAGNTWTRLMADTSTRPTYFTHPLAAVSADSFAVAMAHKIWRTTNGGQSFSLHTLPNGLYRNDLFAARSGRLLATDSLGIVTSADFGLSWQPLFSSERLLKVVEKPGLVQIALTEDISGNGQKHLYRSLNNGLTWNPLGVPGFPSSIYFWDIAIDQQGVLYVNGFGGHYSQVARSADLGTTWSFAAIPDIYASNNPIAVNALGHIFTAGYASNDPLILCSVDQGNSWFNLPPNSQHSSLLNSFELSPSGRLYVVPTNDPVYRSAGSTTTGGYIQGHIRLDADAECSTPDAQEPLKNWLVEVNGDRNFTVTTGVSGQYSIFTDPGEYAVQARVPQQLWWSICDSLLVVQVDSAQVTDSVDFVAIAAADCPLMTVDVGIPRLRRCFDNTVYVAYCNIGSETATHAWIDIDLDPSLNFVGSSQTHTPLGNNRYRFDVGDVPFGACGQFTLVVEVDCDSTVIGQTHCILARAFPDTLCTPVASWSGATIEAEANCQDTTIRLRLRNTGLNASDLLHYIIIEDDVVLLQGQKQYDSGETMTFDYLSNGRTWRIESQQEPNHPFSNLALAFLEGCGGFNSLGFVNRFSVNGWEPSIDRECVENIGSFDPNDKQGFPLGTGPEGKIRPGQALEYRIRFQNTGTDTAFTVMIRDTLSPWLDPATLRPGAASHEYEWSLSGDGILTFLFENILLPDSNVNLSGSQGFVSFQVDQRPDIPLETQILNSAAIYFDFNEPVITNQTLHTIGIDYITSTVSPFGPKSLPEIRIQPNPAVGHTQLILPPGTLWLSIYDSRGRLLRTLRAHEPLLQLTREPTAGGVYWLRAEDRYRNITGWGKLVWR